MLELASILCFLVFAALAIWGFKRPGYHCAMVLCFLVIEQIFAYRFTSIFMANTKLPDLAVGLIVLSGALWNRSFNSRNLPLSMWWGAILFLYAGFSVSWSPDPKLSWEIYIKVLPLTILACFLAPLLLRKASDIRDLINGTLLFGVPACVVFALGEKYGRSLALDTGREIMELQPLASAQLAGYIVILATYKLFQPTDLKWRMPTLVIVILFGLYTIASTSSRGQVLAIFPVVLTWLPISLGKRGLSSAFIATFLAGILAFASYFIIDRFNFGERWRSDLIESGTNFRLEMSSDLLKYYSQSDGITLLFGLGSSASYRIIQAFCHVVPVEVLCELGLIGFVVYLFIYVRTAVDGAKCVSQISVTNLRIDLASLYGIALYDFILSLKQGSLLGGYTFACLNLVAMATCAIKTERKKRASLGVGLVSAGNIAAGKVSL